MEMVHASSVSLHTTRMFEPSKTIADLISVACDTLHQSGSTKSVSVTPTRHQNAGAEPTVQTLYSPRSDIPQSMDSVRHKISIKFSDILCSFVVPQSVLWAFNNPATPRKSPRIHCLRLILGRSRLVSILESRLK